MRVLRRSLPHGVYQDVVRRGEEVALGLAALHVLHLLPQPREALLHDVLRGVGIAQVFQREAVHAIAVQVHAGVVFL
ncbi:MAG: hypothetical protein QM724_02570 [Flavobacteriales bacterium]